MKKVLNFLLTSFYAFLLIMLAIFSFWELYAKDYMIDHFDTKYGNNIIQMTEDCKLLKSYELPLKDDKNTSTRTRN